MNHAFPGLGIPAGFKRLPWKLRLRLTGTFSGPTLAASAQSRTEKLSEVTWNMW